MNGENLIPVLEDLGLGCEGLRVTTGARPVDVRHEQAMAPFTRSVNMVVGGDGGGPGMLCRAFLVLRIC